MELDRLVAERGEAVRVAGRRNRGSARPMMKPSNAASSRAKISGMLVVEKKNSTSTFWVFCRMKIAARTIAMTVM